MFRFEVRGIIRQNGEVIPFVTITPPCMTAYQAALYVTGKFNDDSMDVAIDHSATVRIIK